MRILLLCEGNPETHDSWSGISKSVLTTLRNAGHEVLTSDVDLYGVQRWIAVGLTYSPRRSRWGARYHFAKAPFEFRSRNAEQCIAACRDRVDVILQFGATFEPRGHGDIPYVLYCDSNIRLAQRNRRSGYGEAVSLDEKDLDEIDEREASIYSAAACICTISDYLARSFADDYAISAERIRTIHAGPNFDLEKVAPPAESYEDTGAEPTILFVGRQFGRKGGDLLLDAFAHVRDRVPNARLVLVGPQGLEVSDSGVSCVGLLNKDDPEDLAILERLYRDARVFCLPSRFDCFPISFLEAMAYGLPCVGTSIAGVPEIIEDGETGFVVPPDDAGTLANSLIHILNDPKRASAMGRKGRRRLEDRFTWPIVVDRMLKAMQNSYSEA